MGEHNNSTYNKTKNTPENQEPPLPPTGGTAGEPIQGALIPMETKPDTWGRWSDPMEAFEDIAAIYPKRRQVAKARDWWRKQYARKPKPEQAETAADIFGRARLIAERWPRDEICYLPALDRFVREAWEDDWRGEIDRKVKPKDGGLTNAEFKKRHDVSDIDGWGEGRPAESHHCGGPEEVPGSVLDIWPDD